MHNVWYRKAWRILSRLDFGVVLLALLLGSIFLGTMLPQFPQRADTHAWWEAVRTRYGLLYGPMRTLGLFGIFSTLWFKILVGLLLLSTLACFLNRVLPLSKVVFRPRTRLSVERFERAEWRAHLDFPSAQEAESALCSALEQRHYRVQVEDHDPSGQDTCLQRHLRADRHWLPRLGTLLTHIGLVCLLLGAAWSGLRSWRVHELTLDSRSAASIGNGTGVRIRSSRFTIIWHDDGTPQDYRADVTLISENGKELKQGTVRLNQPLTYAGVSYYLQGYHVSQPSSSSPSEAQKYQVILNAVYEPGFGPVIAAGLCVLVGVALTFHFPHKRLWARIKGTGETMLVGSTAWDQERFTRQFETLVADLKVAAASPAQANSGEGNSG